MSRLGARVRCVRLEAPITGAHRIRARREAVSIDQIAPLPEVDRSEFHLPLDEHLGLQCNKRMGGTWPFIAFIGSVSGVTTGWARGINVFCEALVSALETIGNTKEPCCCGYIKQV